MAITLDELIRLGIDKETQTEQFYRYWAQRLADPGAKVLLSDLADEESKHRVFFENLKPSDIETGPAPKVMDLHIGDYLVERQISEDSQAQDVLISAIHRETTAIKFFTDLAQQSGKMRPTFERLASEEKKHKLRLETFYDDAILTDD